MATLKHSWGSLISIHLMLLFNGADRGRYFIEGHFNTSNVTIQHIYCTARNVRQAHFNTSNVTIQQHVLRERRSYFKISIHLMLLFNNTHFRHICLYIIISIHLMLLFNYFAPFIDGLSKIISIHLMLLFNDYFNKSLKTIYKFQYI